MGSKNTLLKMCTFVDLLKTSQYFLFMTALNRFSFFFWKREIKKKKTVWNLDEAQGVCSTKMFCDKVYLEITIKDKIAWTWERTLKRVSCRGISPGVGYIRKEHIFVIRIHYTQDWTVYQTADYKEPKSNRHLFSLRYL